MLGALLCVLSIFGPISRVSVNGLHYTAGAIPYRASRPPQSIRVLHRFPNENPERLKSMAAELVAMNVDVLMGGALASGYLRDATKTIPIVFMFIPDPVGMKFVQNLARPGGNATGLSNFGADIAGKRLQLLRELVPGLVRVG